MREASSGKGARRGPGASVWLAGAIAVALLAAAVVARCAIDAARYPVELLARTTPRRTALMLQREREARDQGLRYREDQRWLPYDRTSVVLRRAVLVAEDDAFFAHGGLDWSEIGESARRNLARWRIVRGGSTITQQLARNLYLGDQRTITRKLTEAFLALRLERALSKRRIFELYLNLIEWGDGIYGAEAAARRYFGVSAGSLDARQSVLLAAVIVNPRRFSVLSPSRRIERRVRIIAGRLRRRGVLDGTQYAIATGAEPPSGGLFGLLRWFQGAPDTAPPMAPEDSTVLEPKPADSLPP